MHKKYNAVWIDEADDPIRMVMCRFMMQVASQDAFVDVTIFDWKKSSSNQPQYWFCIKILKTQKTV